MKTAHLDVIALWDALDARRRQIGVSWRQAADAMNVCPSTLSRMQNYKHPSAEGLIRMLDWLGAPPLARFTRYGKRAL